MCGAEKVVFLYLFVRTENPTNRIIEREKEKCTMPSFFLNEPLNHSVKSFRFSKKDKYKPKISPSEKRQENAREGEKGIVREE